MIGVKLMLILLFYFPSSFCQKNPPISCAQCGGTSSTKCDNGGKAADIPCDWACTRKYNYTVSQPKRELHIVERGCLTFAQHSEEIKLNPVESQKDSKVKCSNVNETLPFAYTCTCEESKCNDVLRCHVCEDCPGKQEKGKEVECDLESKSGIPLRCRTYVDVKKEKIVRGCYDPAIHNYTHIGRDNACNKTDIANLLDVVADGDIILSGCLCDSHGCNDSPATFVPKPTTLPTTTRKKHKRGEDDYSDEANWNGSGGLELFFCFLTLSVFY